MLRAVLAVIAGYIALAVAIFVLFSMAYLAMGADRAYEPGSFAVSTLWLLFAVPITFIVAMIGGWVCRVIAGRTGPVWALAIVAVVLGVIEATYVTLNPREPEERAADVSLLDATGKAVQPTWVVWLNPVLGFVGILLGGSALGGTKDDREL